jgi:hypothetical protein
MRCYKKKKLGRLVLVWHSRAQGPRVVSYQNTRRGLYDDGTLSIYEISNFRSDHSARLGFLLNRLSDFLLIWKKIRYKSISPIP